MLSSLKFGFLMPFAIQDNRLSLYGEDLFCTCTKVEAENHYLKINKNYLITGFGSSFCFGLAVWTQLGLRESIL